MAKDKEKSGNWFARHKVLTVIGGFIAIGIIASAAGGGSKTPSTTNDNAKASASPTAEKTATTAKIGQIANDGRFQFTVTGMKCGEPNVSDVSGYITKNAQGQYCLLHINVKNTGDKAQTLDSMSQYVYNSKGQKYSSDDEATIYINPTNGTFLNQINPGNTVKGTVVFDIPKDVKPVTAELHDSALSGGVKVDLR